MQEAMHALPDKQFFASWSFSEKVLEKSDCLLQFRPGSGSWSSLKDYTTLSGCNVLICPLEFPAGHLSSVRAE
jgi:hypothetical protein